MRLRVVRRGWWQILAVCRERGDCPLLEFLTRLPPNLRKDGRRVQALFDRIQHKGPPHNVELSHRLTDNLWELVRGRLRVVWFYDEGRLILITHGFVKKSQKTPRIEIEKAEASRTAYLRAKRTRALIVEEDE